MPEQMSGLKPTWQDTQWYEQQKEKERTQQAQGFAGQTGVIGDALMSLGGYAKDAFKENSDHPIARMALDMLGGLGDADYMAKTQATTMHGETGGQFLGALEVADTAVSLGATGALRNAPKLAKQAAEAGAKDIQSLGVGQATLQAARGLGDKIPPMGPQLQMSLAGATNGQVVAQNALQQNVMKAVTTTNKEVLGTVGVKTGDNIISPEQGKRLIKRSAEIENKKGTIERINTDIEALTELKGDPKNLQKYIDDSDDFLRSYWDAEGGNVDEIIRRLKNAKERAQPALSQAQSNVAPFTKDGDFQQWYKTTAGKNARSAEAKARGIKQVLQEHHLFPKGISAAYFDAMDRLISQGKARPDDLVLMFEYAVKKGRTPGDYRVNIKNLPPKEHGTLHNEGFRTKGYKAELPKSDYVQELKDVKDVDDLMQRWVEVLDGDVAYQMETAQLWEDMSKLIADVQK